MSLICPTCSCKLWYAKLEQRKDETFMILICSDCSGFMEFDPQNIPVKVPTEGNA